MMFALASLELVVMWLIWLYPFIRKRFDGSNRKANVMAHSANWGLVLESAGIACAWFWWPNTPLPGLVRIIPSMILAPLATFFGWLAVRHLGKQLRIFAGLYPDHELVRTGPYAVVRHPVYASMFLMMIATGLLFARWPMLLLAVVLYVAGTEIRIHVEEGLLRSRFGDEFENYRRRVPAYLPFLR